MTSTITFPVRPATMRDAKHIAELQHTVVRDTPRSTADGATASEIPLDKRQAFWREAVEFGEPQVLVALDGDKIVGFVGFDRSRDRGTPQTMGEIWAIYVLPSYWGRGVGSALWKSARKGLQEEGCTQVSIWLSLSNERALRFHEQAGFKREPASSKAVATGKGTAEEIRLKRSLL